MITTSLVAPDTYALATSSPGPGGMLLPVNAYCLRGAEPTLVDTGLSPQTEEFRSTLWSLVEPADLRMPADVKAAGPLDKGGPPSR